MGRRRLVILVSGVAMVLLGVVSVASLIAATQSVGGRDWIRRQLARELNRGIKGKLTLGRLSGSFLTDLTIDSVLITGPDDSLFIASGPVRVTYDPRDIFDGRIIVRSVEVEHPFLVMRRQNDDRWNFREVFPADDNGPGGLPQARRAFGALVLFHNVRLRGGQFQLTLPWAPDDSLRGARRDSAVAANLAVTDNEIRRVVVKGRGGYQRTWRWTDWSATLNRIRFRHPDSTGRRFDIARMDVTERVPPFVFHNMQGGLLWRGDSIWLDLPHFELPGSSARATGSIMWGSDLPIRYDIKIHGDSVSLNDVSWIYRTLPRTGSGSMDLRIRNERTLSILDYIITNMDVRTGTSRLKGAMTYGVGGPVLLVKDVSLEFAPADFALLETLNGQKFPLPWNGKFTGTARARGGPVNHFQVDEASLAFADGNVPGATASGVGRGELDILNPAFTAFHAFQVSIARFDLRTAQSVNPSFPRLNGIVSGTATLDSVWTDVRFRDGDMTHRDGDDAAASRFRGTGRVTLGDENVTFDVALAALPVSATTLARSYPGIWARGEYSGPLRVRGTAADLAVTGDLVGDAGRLQVDGRFGSRGTGAFATARGSVSGLDLRRALQQDKLPATDLNGRFALSVEGDSLANLLGTARLFADRSVVDGVRVYSAEAALRFGSGGVRVDSLAIESVAGQLTASGGLGLSSRRSDSLLFHATVDSLGGLRRYLAAARDTNLTSPIGHSPEPPDSLEGTVFVSGTLAGWLSRFSMDATVRASDLRIGSATSRGFLASSRFDVLPESSRGAVTLSIDTLNAGRLGLESLTGRAVFADGWRAHATVVGRTFLGAIATASADIQRRNDTTLVHLDGLGFRTSGNVWSVSRAVTIAIAGGGFSSDSLRLVGTQGGMVELAGRIPADSGIDFALRADRVPLADIGELIRTDSALGGELSVHAELRGSRARPDLAFGGLLRDASVGGLRVERLAGEGRYAARRLTTSVEYSRHGVPALRAEATLPIDLAFRSLGPRLLEEPMHGRVRTDSAGLALLEAFSNSVSSAQGSLTFDLDVAGTWRHPSFTGALRVSDGSLVFAPMGNVKLSGLEADVDFLGDSVAVRRAVVRSGSGRDATAELAGTIGIRDITNPTFDLRLTAQAFNIIKNPKIADLDVTGGLRLSGAYDAATLTGSFTVDRGSIYVPELYQKRVISLDDPELYRVVDTSAFVDRRLMLELPTRFVDNLTVRSVPVQMGRDVWLRSAEANINLGGLVSVTRGRVRRGPKAGQVQLALEGPLQTVRGTYRLNLGPVQRAFEVESGEMRFYGDPDLDATLNINALHTVRQFSQQGAHPDVRVRVHIGGSRLAPTAELSSPDSVRVTSGDLVSYLVTGGPSLDIAGRNGDVTSAAARVLLSSSFSVLAAKATGRLCDDAQLSAAGLLEGYQDRIGKVSGNILSGTRFNCAKQVSEKTFVRLDYGFCQVGQLLAGGNAASDLSIADALGLKLDYRLSDHYTASIGTDPRTSAVLCANDANARGFAPTPRQFGLDLFRFWRF